MKFLLTSTGITNEVIKDKFLEMVGKDSADIYVAYIPTAAMAIASIPDKRWVIENLRRLDDMGIGKIDILDIATDKDIWWSRVNQADVLYVEGGKASYLMQAMQNTGLGKMIMNQFKDKVYVGCSAGSIIMAKKAILPSTEKPYYKILEGMGIIDFSIRPHFGRADRLKFDQNMISRISKEIRTAVYAIDDDTAIVVDGDKIEVVSEGKWKKFE